jgi:hypothetical protein
MTSSPAGATAFFVLALLTICSLVVLLLRYYLPLRTTPAYVTVPVFLSIALPASIVLLVPIDLASSAGTDTDGGRGIWLSDRVVYKSWRITYWLTFALTWIILPYLGEFCDSGYREPRDRLLYAVRSNGRYQLMMLASAIVGAVYILWQNGFHWESFKGLVMALAYAWGLILAIYLMGHGLVAFPRTLYRYASISHRLKMLQSQAPKVHERLTESLEKLDNYEYQVLQLKQRKNGTAQEFQEWIEELGEKSSLPESRAGVVGQTNTATVPPVITARYLAELPRKLKRARHARMRFSAEWDNLVAKALRTQAILDSKASQRLDFKHSLFNTPKDGFWSRLTLFTPYTRYHLHAGVIPALYYLASVITALASISIVWSECVRSLEPKFSLIGLTVIHHPPSSRGRIGFGGQVIAAAWLCYMCICAFFSLTEVKVWGNRALVKRHTYLESATWYSLQVAKLTVPLAYNFITFTPPVIYRDTSFHKFLGSLIDLTPLGRNFSDYFPAFILVPVLASLFGLYAKVKSICGFGDLLEDEEDGEGSAYGTGSWREGRALIEREVHGANGNVLGLSQRSGLISPPSGRYSDEPTSSSSVGGGGATAQGRPGAASSSSRLQRDGRRPRMPPLLGEDEDGDGNGDGDGGSFFSDFAVRVKNTFETADFSFTRPRWMGGDDDDDDDGGRSSGAGLGVGVGGGSGSGSRRGEGWRSLFGGRAEEGRLRL